MTQDLDILGFDPRQLSSYENKVHGQNNYHSYYDERKLNYPYVVNKHAYESHSNDAADIVSYIINEMTRNSIEHEKLLETNQYDKKDEWHDNHHSSWERQVIDFKFYSNIYRNMSKILRCVDKLKENANTYSISKQLYNTWKANMVKYIWDGESKKYQIEWFVDGIMKFIFSAVWDYSELQWVLENPICSYRYEFKTEKWVKINDK